MYWDLKPENILIDSLGHIKLTDFGLSRENLKKGDKSNSFCGTPAYLSPEMVNKVGHDRSIDLYGIGIVLYEMMVGEVPF